MKRGNGELGDLWLMLSLPQNMYEMPQHLPKSKLAGLVEQKKKSMFLFVSHRREFQLIATKTEFI